MALSFERVTFPADTIVRGTVENITRAAAGASGNSDVGRVSSTRTGRPSLARRTVNRVRGRDPFPRSRYNPRPDG